MPWCCSNKSNAKPAAVLLDEAPAGARGEEDEGSGESVDERTFQLKGRGISEELAAVVD